MGLRGTREGLPSGGGESQGNDGVIEGGDKMDGERSVMTV